MSLLFSIFFVACGEGTTPAQHTEAQNALTSRELAAATNLALYGDTLAAGWSDWSWATHSLSATAVVHSGQDAISFNPNAYAGVMFVTGTPWPKATYAAVDFWVYPTASGELLSASLYDSDGSGSTQVNLGGLVAGGALPAKTWTHITIPYTSFAANANAVGLVIQGQSAGNQAVVYLDDITFDVAAASTTTSTSTTGTTTSGGATTGTTSATTAGGTTGSTTGGGGATSVYADALANGYADWSWAPHSLTETAIVHSGKDAVSFNPNAYAGIMFVTSAPWTAATYSAFDFWVYPTSASESLFASLYYANGSGSTQVNIATLAPGGVLPPNTWTHITVPFSALATSGSVSGLVLQGGVAGNQTVVYVDDVALDAPGGSSTTTGGASTTTGGATTTGGTTTATTGGGTSTTGGSTTTTTGGTTQTTPIFTDALAAGYADWSWATHNISETSVVHSGKDAISMVPSAYQGVMFVTSSPWNATTYNALDFWVFPTAASESLLASLYYANGTGSTQVNIATLVSGGALPANTWTHITVPLSDFAASGSVSGVVIQGGLSGTQATVYIDDISLDSPATSTGGTTGSVAPIAWPAVVFGDNPGGNDPNAVALSFDDGPDGASTGLNNTGYVLDQLKALGLHATFFVCGKLWTDVTTDSVAQADIRRIISEGHDIGSHTLDHPYLDTITQAQVGQEFAQNLAAFQNPNVLGAGFNMSMYRAPFGVPFQANNPNVSWVSVPTQAYGVHVGWGIDSDDWKCAQNGQDANCIINNVQFQLNQGHSGVILMHAVYKLTGDALPAVVQAIKNRGYHIVMVQDFIKAKYGATSTQILQANENASFSPSQISSAAANTCSQNDFAIDPPF